MGCTRIVRIFRFKPLLLDAGWVTYCSLIAKPCESMSSITYASFANLINTPSKQKQHPPPPSSDGSLSSTVFVPRSISPTPSLGWDSPQISHRSMPGTPNTEAFSSLPSSRSPTPSPVNMYQRHDKYYIQDEMDEFLVRYLPLSPYLSLSDCARRSRTRCSTSIDIISTSSLMEVSLGNLITVGNQSP